MADTLKVYKGSEVVGSAVRGVDGKAVVTINDLEADTNYASGDYKVSFSNEGGESAKVNVPAFKTKPINVTGVTLNKASTTLDTGATETLTATVAPSTASNKSVTYSSSSTGVATVDNNGKITAVAVGTSDITVTTADGNKTAKCTVTVTAKQIPVTGVTLDKSTLSLEEGATATLNATIAPSNASYKAVSFTSSDDAIATVDNNGLVTAVAAGSADITVESLMDGSKTATCTVTVEEAVIAVTGVTIAPKTASVDVGATTQLSSTVAPANATNKAISYASSDSAIATVNASGLVTGVAEGTANITVTTTDGSKTDVSAITVNAVVEPDPEV